MRLLPVLEGLLIAVSAYSLWQTYEGRALRQKLEARQFLINSLIEQLQTAQDALASAEIEHKGQISLTHVFANVLHSRDMLIQSLYTYQRTIEMQTVEQREEVEELYARYDIITEHYQSIINQRNQRILDLIIELDKARRGE
jgi:hypothetical protein